MNYSVTLRAALICTFFAITVSHPPAMASESYAPLFGARMVTGLELNTGGNGGSAVELGGINIYYAHFLSEKVSLGLAYQADIDYVHGNVLLSGFDLFGRYYLSGGASVRQVDSQDVVSTYRVDRTIYTGAMLSERGYFLGANTLTLPGVPLTGSYASAGVLVGADFPLSRHLKINVEADVALLTFASSDNRFRLQGFNLLTGISYVW